MFAEAYGASVVLLEEGGGGDAFHAEAVTAGEGYGVGEDLCVCVCVSVCVYYMYHFRSGDCTGGLWGWRRPVCVYVSMFVCVLHV